MKTVTHRIAGIALAAAIIAQTDDYFLAAGVVVGATAPDWLEISKRVNGIRHSVIPHRTVTHWFLPWVTVLLYSIMFEGAHWSLVSGFAIGGLLHISMDAATPMGVPLLNPFANRKKKVLTT